MSDMSDMSDLNGAGANGGVPSRVEHDDIPSLLATLPPHIRREIDRQGRAEALVEIVLDLGRAPYARYFEGESRLSETEVTAEDLAHIVSQLGEFGEDNRAGIPRTLHRIACLRNRQRAIVGLTMRVGRSVSGSVAVIQDFVETGVSILLLGRPGVGKTTLLREVARVLAEQGKRVVIVDTSNEIAGDGDIPHAGIGRARRMQVERPERQHAVMVEAVENHMPEVIVIDEIGAELEALAARTIAERGVQLVATAHGNVLANLMLNPTLSDLIGGIQTVTLSDEEARRRGTRKSVLERKAPPTFEALVEIQSFDRVAVHADVGATVDALLRGESVQAEIRELDDDGEVHVHTGAPAAPLSTWQTGLPGDPATHDQWERTFGAGAPPSSAAAGGNGHEDALRQRSGRSGKGGRSRDRRGSLAGEGPHRRIYPLGISVPRLREAIRESGANASIAERVEEADTVMTLRSAYRRSPPERRWAESRRLPVAVIKHNTVLQMEQSLRALSRGASPGGNDAVTAALVEAEEAIAAIHAGSQSAVELTPQNAYVRKLQHQLAADQALTSTSRGKEPHRRVRIQA